MMKSQEAQDLQSPPTPAPLRCVLCGISVTEVPDWLLAQPPETVVRAHRIDGRSLCVGCFWEQVHSRSGPILTPFCKTDDKSIGSEVMHGITPVNTPSPLPETSPEVKKCLFPETPAAHSSGSASTPQEETKATPSTTEGSTSTPALRAVRDSQDFPCTPTQVCPEFQKGGKYPPVQGESGSA